MTKDWVSGDVSANGVRLHYYRTGGSAGGPQPSILMLHGITDSGRTWTRVAEVLAPDYDVVMLDARGHGLSEETESGYTAEDQAPDVAGVIQALGLGRVLLMGHSMGAATAVASAAHFPAVVRALILEDPPWGTSGPPATASVGREAPAGDTSGPPATASAGREAPAGDTSGSDTAAQEERATRSAEWRRSILKRKAQPLAEIVAFGTRRLPGWDARDIAAWAEAKQQASPNIASGINGRGIRWQDVVRLVRCPLWVIYGDRAAGAIVTAATVAEARALAPQLESIHVPGAGHEVRRGHYAEFMAALRMCLRKITVNNGSMER